MKIDELGIESYYLHTQDIMEVTDNGAASLVTYAKHKEVVIKLNNAENRLKIAENRIAKLSEENSKLNDAKDFLIKYYNPQDTRFKNMIDSFVSFDDDQKNKLIKLSASLADLKL